MDVATLLVHVVAALATVATAVIALCFQYNSSNAANEIASKSVEVSQISADLQLQLDKLNEKRKEPNIVLHRAGGTAAEFVYTLQNIGEKDAVILELSLDTIEDRDRKAASKKELVSSSLQSSDDFRHTINLSTLPFAQSYELGMPIIIGPGGVVQMRLTIPPNIPYAVFHASYNDWKQVELSHTHINRVSLE